ncbi:hypothetical protein ACEK07_22965 [Alcanivoracaceae bacterium MT1]
MEWGDLGITALVSGVISSLIGSWFKHRAELSIVRAQAELEKDAIRHQIRYGSLHEKRFEFLVNLYPGLVELGSFCAAYANDGHGQDSEKAEQFQESFESLKLFFEANRILLPVSLDNLIADALKDHYLLPKMIKISERNAMHTTDDKKAEEAFERVDEYFEKLNHSVESVRQKVRNEIAKLIGSEEGAGA